jgi:hypothetical protein
LPVPHYVFSCSCSKVHLQKDRKAAFKMSDQWSTSQGNRIMKCYRLRRWQ